MACYHPLRAWRSDDGEILFAERGRIHSQITLACGQCIGCRLERSRQWAVRCMHESKTHQHNSFLTLTYSDENLVQKYWTGEYYTRGPRAGEKAYSGNLNYRDFQLFMKKLIKKTNSPPPQRGAGAGGILTTRSTPQSAHDAPQTAAARRALNSSNVRFYMAGEYGTQYGRPHFHACLFGATFNDLKYLGRTPSGSKLWRSSTLEQLWPHGFSSVGELTFESAAYVARYVMKKITGTKAKTHYEKVDHDTGEIIELKPEFNQMSRGQGIGKNWLERFEADVYPHAKLIVRGHKTQPPRYYDKLYKKSHPTEWEAIEYDRFLEGQKRHQDQLPHRLQAREKVAAAKISMLKRKI